MFPLSLYGAGYTLRTWFHKFDSFGLGKLQGCHPFLPLHLRASLQVEALGASVRDDKGAWVRVCVDEGIGQVDSTTAGVRHLRLRPGNIQYKFIQVLPEYRSWMILESI